jgi:hypothetical protein
LLFIVYLDIRYLRYNFVTSTVPVINRASVTFAYRDFSVTISGKDNGRFNRTHFGHINYYTTYMHPWTVALIILVVIIALFAIFFKRPNITKDGSNWTAFNIMRAVVLVGILVVGVIYWIFKNK